MKKMWKSCVSVELCVPTEIKSVWILWLGNERLTPLLLGPGAIAYPESLIAKGFAVVEEVLVTEMPLLTVRD